jgi:putative NADH-flavin reductase
MKNAETPVVKVVLYGAMSSLGSALMAEMLRRQHEVIANGSSKALPAARRWSVF